MYFLLGLIPKGNGKFCKIHLFFFYQAPLSMIFSRQKAMHLHYTSLNKVPLKVVEAGRHYVIIKCNIKDDFVNTFMLPYFWGFFGFCWRTFFHTENFLSFRFSASIFIFNLFAEDFHRVFQSFLSWDFDHYLDNFVAFLPTIKTTSNKIQIESKNNACPTDILRIPW